MAIEELQKLKRLALAASKNGDEYLCHLAPRPSEVLALIAQLEQQASAKEAPAVVDERQDADGYFGARQWKDTPENRTIYSAGHRRGVNRGFECARKAGAVQSQHEWDKADTGATCVKCGTVDWLNGDQPCRGYKKGQ